MSTNPKHSASILITLGLLAGPLFCIVFGLQILTRDGFDLMKHPISLLSLGDLGWIQISNFIISGLLTVVGALGLYKARRKKTLGPLFFGIFGLGLATAGVFLTDASMGFPPGAPTGQVAPTWHGTLHWVSAIIGLVAAITGMIVYRRYFVSQGEKVWAKVSLWMGIATLIISFWPDNSSMSWRFAIAITLLFAWFTATCARELSSAPLRKR